MDWVITFIIIFCILLWLDCWIQKNRIRKILIRYMPIAHELSTGHYDLKEHINNWLDAQ